MKIFTLLLLACGLGAGCGFDDLDRAPEPSPEGYDDLEGAVTIEGIQVLPAVIHPGDQVTLREPTRTPRGQPAAIYVWTACDGAIEGGNWGRETTWTAPSEPGAYAVTVNIGNSRIEEPSRVLSLCVVGDGEEPCGDPASPAPVLESLTATPGSFVQALECPGGCQSAIEADVTVPDGAGARFVWTTRGGEVEGEGGSVRWYLPAVGCCTESYTAAVTICGDEGTAGTGQVNVVVVPG